ncbi:hypothetical protein [Chitinophaga agri]|uniref:Transglutaminase-like domain-containing protein n=1 Tax=Chitinophaga agri TaxID=2703787 RepID=A0A6B9ZHL6_9BACT|nr:hypothetical protein [Chitinophaga agri]QHS60824.1 hypothetical protein GWR21_14830 [Chitinophaga agri]
MQAATNRQVQDGAKYAHLFPTATGIIKTIKTDATVGDTLAFIKKIVPATLQQTQGIANVLKGRNTYETCRNIWHFVYDHIRYRKDRDGFEQVRSPRRSWVDRKKGVDCDCYTTFISSILCNLRIPHILRITKYSKPHFQHIYPVVPYGDRCVTVDCVTDKFDYEVPYSEKKDMLMDLQYLDGLDALLPYTSKDDRIVDGLDGDDDFGELGLFGKKKKKKQAEDNDPMKNPDAVPGTGKKKKKGFFKKILNVANKVNPVTLALRNGVLVAMKLNIGKIGSRLRWSYLSPNAAKAKGIDIARYQQLVKTRQKLEDIFSNAGGNPANMKKAILKGKGNKDHAVNGLLGLGAVVQDDGIMGMNIYTPLPQLLGPEIYYDENVRGMEGFEGFGELGEPATLASVAAASSVIAAIAASLKKIGDIFKGKKTEGSEDFSEEAAAAADTDVAAVKDAAPAAAATNPATAAAASTFTTSDNSNENSTSSVAMMRSASDTSTETEDTSAATSSADVKKGFWNNNKKWIIPVGIGVGVIGAYALTRKSSVPAKAHSRPLNGPPCNKNYHRKPRGDSNRGKSKNRKTPIALM